MHRKHTTMDSILKYRSHLVVEAQRELGTLYRRFAFEENKLHQLDLNRKKVIDKMTARKGTGLGVEEINLAHQYVKFQGDRMKHQKQTIKNISEDIETHRSRLEQLLQDKKMVENIRDKRQKLQNDLFKKNENTILDEASVRRERSIL